MSRHNAFQGKRQRLDVTVSTDSEVEGLEVEELEGLDFQILTPERLELDPTDEERSRCDGSLVSSKIRWMPSGLIPTLRRCDCGGLPGDCLFECIAVWVKFALNLDKRPTASHMRVEAANMLTAEKFNIMNDDIATGEEPPLSACMTIEDLRARIVGNVWGCHSILLLLLSALSRRAGEPVGALVAYRCDRAPHPLDIEPANPARHRVVLYHDEEARHYQLLGDTSERLVYVTPSQDFKAQL